MTTTASLPLILLPLLLMALPVLTLASRLRFFNSGTCPYAQRAWIALEECGVPYEKIMVDLQNKPQHFIELYQRANQLPGARAKVPLLHVVNDGDDDDVLLCESLVVSEYLAEVHGKGSLLASSPEDRARVRLFTELCGSSFSYFPLLRAHTDDGGGGAPAALLESFKDGLIGADALLRGSKDGPFLLGKHFSLAECNAAPFLQRCCAILPVFTKVDPLQLCDELGLDRLKVWIEAVLVRSSVLTTGISMEDMRESTTRMLAKFAAMEKDGESTSK